MEDLEMGLKAMESKIWLNGYQQHIRCSTSHSFVFWGGFLQKKIQGPVKLHIIWIQIHTMKEQPFYNNNGDIRRRTGLSGSWSIIRED